MFRLTIVLIIIFNGYFISGYNQSATVKTNIQAKNSSSLKGFVEFEEKEDKVIMHVEISNASPGLHAIHIHEKGDCSSADGKSAKGHWNPTETKHGEWQHEHFHRGDIDNLKANKEGEATLEFSTDLWCLGCADEKKNIIGKSIIIHQKEDDFHSQPSGAAGKRIGCAVIR